MVFDDDLVGESLTPFTKICATATVEDVRSTSALFALSEKDDDSWEIIRKHSTWACCSIGSNISI